MQAVDLVNNLSPTRFSKHLLTFEPGLDLLERIDRATITFHHCPRKSKFDYSGVREIAKIIDDHSIDIVHCTLQMSLLRGWLGARLAKRKPRLVVVLHTTVNISRKSELLDSAVMQWLMRDCEKVICVCRAQEEYWRSKYPSLAGKTQVIYNGVDTDKFSPKDHLDSGRVLRRQLGISEEAKVITHIAGFRREKGHVILLNAFRILIRCVPNAFLLFVGDGMLRPDIEKRARDAALESQVRFLGIQSDVRPVLSVSDCSVLVSTAVETFSMAMLESMAMGVPLVATNVGGTSEAVLDGETGFLVNPGDIKQLAEALAIMLSDDARRATLGYAAKALVDMKFNASLMNTQTEHMLREVASE